LVELAVEQGLLAFPLADYWLKVMLEFVERLDQLGASFQLVDDRHLKGPLVEMLKGLRKATRTNGRCMTQRGPWNSFLALPLGG
jgi:hypothetical protein